MFPTTMFATDTQRKILRVLSEKNKQYTMDELMEMCHRSQPAISRALGRSDRYPFISRDRIANSRRLVFGLNSDSEYTSPIREFFRIERRRERRDGTVPVDVWNLLEDATVRIEQKIDSFVELYLFGSYATGEYYSGSDVDLLLATDGERKRAYWQAYEVIQQLKANKEVQLVTIAVEPASGDELRQRELIGEVRRRGPVRDIDTLIPLSGNTER